MQIAHYLATKTFLTVYNLFLLSCFTEILPEIVNNHGGIHSSFGLTNYLSM